MKLLIFLSLIAVIYDELSARRIKKSRKGGPTASDIKCGDWEKEECNDGELKVNNMEVKCVVGKDLDDTFCGYYDTIETARTLMPLNPLKRPGKDSKLKCWKRTKGASDNPTCHSWLEKEAKTSIDIFKEYFDKNNIKSNCYIINNKYKFCSSFNQDKACHFYENNRIILLWFQSKEETCFEEGNKQILGGLSAYTTGIVDNFLKSVQFKNDIFEKKNSENFGEARRITSSVDESPQTYCCKKDTDEVDFCLKVKKSDSEQDLDCNSENKNIFEEIFKLYKILVKNEITFNATLYKK
jgi:hypothetical protein